ncbi:MAG: UMP kinase [Bacilli bacterium]|nr:UMP kinase [Bacilli bacterium]
MNKTVLIKLSGESLAGSKGFGLDFEYINKVCLEIKKIYDMGIRVGIVCGGGNFLRGRDTKEMDRETADYTGMMATVMNSLVLKDVFTKLECEVYNQSGLDISIIDSVNSEKAIDALNNGKIVIFGGGTGKPFFSTDTGASLRAIDIKADMIIKLTNVDGVYDKDPNVYSDALMYDKITYQEVIDKKIGVMDLAAIEMCMNNDIEIVVINIDLKNGLVKVINGEKIGTKILK